MRWRLWSGSVLSANKNYKTILSTLYFLLIRTKIYVRLNCVNVCFVLWYNLEANAPRSRQVKLYAWNSVD
jgi:hypothetical protein